MLRMFDYFNVTMLDEVPVLQSATPGIDTCSDSVVDFKGFQDCVVHACEHDLYVLVRN